jgi:phytoene desaturase
LEKVIIIGSGIAGLASAVRMAVKGHQVQVFEANAYPGGKLSEMQVDGFRFDAGPSLFTMPELVDELFTLAGRNPKDYFHYQKLDSICNYFYPDGTTLKAHAQSELFINEVSEKLNVQPDIVQAHLNKSAFIYRHTAHLFLEKSLHRIQSYLTLKSLRSIFALPFLGINQSMNMANEKALQNEKLVQLFNRYATYNGSNPYVCPAVLNIIPHLEFSKGAYFPKGGMISITNAIYKLAVELGVDFQFNSKVEKINIEAGEAKSVVVNGATHAASIVICNMDVAYAYQHLLNNPKKTSQILKQERSSSALIFYWGINRSFAELDLHNILFSSNYAEEFKQIFEAGDVHHDPTVYINITSKYSSADAPANMENWFVMINVPSNKGQDWDKIIQAARANIITKLSKMLGIDLGVHIIAEQILEPRSIDSKTLSYQGSLYGSSSNNKMAAFFRHPNFSRDYKNLYFCGGSVHPGGGIPLALSSAKIIDQIIPNSQS